MPKTVTVKRKTGETDIEITLGIYGKGRHMVKTGIAFLDHMLSLFAKHGLFDLEVKAKGDLDVDIHHTNEDVAITLGEAFSKALGKRAGIKRFGEATVPMDESLVRTALDISGRPFLKFREAKKFSVDKTDAEGYSLNYAEQFLKAFADNARMTLHVDILEAKDLHHIIEAVFKSMAKAMLRAVEKEPRSGSVPSTKGRI
ncbi:MAG TPA: imidazoleglycerol-phosphate dehydratase HisB [Candidatus Omnitrophica bacterium]|nr:imidazoleglycerol-phosphate dehydratase HisB [Candidatus Omnitrophota bacterium]